MEGYEQVIHQKRENDDVWGMKEARILVLPCTAARAVRGRQNFYLHG